MNLLERAEDPQLVVNNIRRLLANKIPAQITGPEVSTVPNIPAQANYQTFQSPQPMTASSVQMSNNVSVGYFLYYSVRIIDRFLSNQSNYRVQNSFGGTYREDAKYCRVLTT